MTDPFKILEVGIDTPDGSCVEYRISYYSAPHGWKEEPYRTTDKDAVNQQVIALNEAFNRGFQLGYREGYRNGEETPPRGPGG